MSNDGSRKITRIFKSGNSQAVCIPDEFAYDDATQEVEVERKGDTLLIRPVERKKLTGISDVFSMFSAGFMAKGRENHEQEDRDFNS